MTPTRLAVPLLVVILGNNSVELGRTEGANEQLLQGVLGPHVLGQGFLVSTKGAILLWAI